MEDKEDKTEGVEADGSVQGHAEQLADLGHPEFSEAVVQKPSQTRTFFRRASSLRERQIPSGPLLDQCSENRATYADGNTGDP